MELRYWTGDTIYFNYDNHFSGSCLTNDIFKVLCSFCEYKEQVKKVELFGFIYSIHGPEASSYTAIKVNIKLSDTDIFLLDKLIEERNLNA